MAEDGKVKIGTDLDDTGLKRGLSGLGNKVKSGAANAGKALVAGFAAATAGAVAFAKACSDAYDVQAQAEAKLEQTAQNQQWTEVATQGLKDYAAEVQKIGIIGDEITIAGQAQLGTFQLSAEAVKTLTPAMDDLIAATAGYDATTENATQMANLMGKVMTGNVGALTRYGVTLDENQKKLLKEGDEMTRATILAEALKQNYGGFNEALAKTPQGKIKQLSNEFGDLQESFGGLLKGKGDLDTVMQQLETFMEHLGELIAVAAPSVVNGITAIFETLVTKLPEFIMQVLPVLLNAVVSLVQSFCSALPGLVASIQDVLQTIVSDVIPNLIQTIVDSAPLVVSALLNLLTSWYTAEAQVITQILSALPELIKNLIQSITEFVNGEGLSMMLQAILEMAVMLVEVIPQVAMAIVDALPQLVLAIVNFFLSNIPTIVQAAIKLLFGIIDAIPTIIVALVGALPQIVYAIYSGLVRNIPEIITGAIMLFMGIIQAIPTIIVRLVAMAPQIVIAFVGGLHSCIGMLFDTAIILGNKLMDGFMTLPGRMLGIGRDIVQGLWQGIQNAAGWLWDKLTGWVGGLVDGIKGLLGIHSPSKVFRDEIGKFMAQGIYVGFEMEDPMDKIATSLKNSVGAIQAGLNINSDNYITAKQQPVETEKPVVLNFYDTQTSPEAIYQKYMQQQTYGLARS